jgi:Domain of unknown function (DUF397)
MTPDMSNARWVRSRACSSDGCVEVAHMASGSVAIRDSKNTHLAAHVFERQEWAAFIAGVKNGEFDLPTS